jgi:hypothetical protein
MFLDKKMRREEFLDFYRKPKILRMMRSIRKRWVQHVARVGQRKGACTSFGGEKRRKEIVWKT